MFSFAKFLELLIWSPTLASLSLCEHTPSISLGTGDHSPSDSRFRILRHFSHKGRVLTFSLTPVHSVFEIRLPKLQILSGSAPMEEKQLLEAKKQLEGEEERQALSTEIDGWWKGIKNRLDKLVSRALSNSSHQRTNYLFPYRMRSLKKRLVRR